MNAQPPPGPLRILLAQDDEQDWLAWQDQIAGEITRCTRATEALERLGSDAASFDLVVVDYKLSDKPGLELCQELLGRECRLPLVLLVASGDEDLAAKALTVGVDNYVIKDPERCYFELLPVVFLKTVRSYHDRLARQRAEKELQQRTAQMEALRQVSLELTAELNLSSLLHSIASRAVELLRGSTGGLYLFRPERDVLEFSVAVGSELAPIGTTLQRGEGLSGKVWETGEPLVLDDYQRWDGRASAWQDYPITVAVSVPVRWGDEFLGVLNVHRDVPHAFAPADAELLSLFATQAAIAIKNARLYEDERQRRQEAETLQEAALVLTAALDRDEVIERVLVQLEKVVSFDSTSVQLLKDDCLEIVGGRGFSNLPDLIGVSFPVSGDNPNHEVVHTQAAFIVADVQAVYDGFSQSPHRQTLIRSWLGVPMLVGERLVGMIALDKQEPGFYTPEHARLAQAFATQAAVAVENSRLFEAQRQQRELAEALAGAAAAVSSTLELDQVFDRILEQVSCVVPNDAANVMLIQDDHVRVVRWRGYEHLGGEAYISGFVFHVHELSNFRAMMESKEPLIVSDTTISPQWVHAPKQGWLRSYVGAPVCLRGQVVGFLNLDSAAPNFFTHTQARTLQTFADHAAIAIENARLFDAQARRRQEAETLRQITAALTSTLDLTQVLDLILEQLAVVVTYDSAAVMLVKEGNLVVVAGRGFPEPARVMGLVFAIEENELFREIQATHSPLILPDAQADVRFLGKGGTGYVRSWMGIPMLIKDRVIGSLTIDNLRPGVYTEADAQIAQAFAQQAAIAIENARLYQELRGHADQLEARVQERTAQLQAQYARLDAILRSTTDGIIVADAQGDIVQTNPVAQTWLAQALSPRDATRLRRVVQDLAQRAGERPKRVLELTGMDLELEAAPILEPDPDSAQDEPVVVVVVHDVSHLKALDRVKSHFITHVSHELRTPITTIKLYTELMRRRPEKREHYLDVLQQQADHQARLVKDILQITQIDAGRLELETRPTRLNELSEIVAVGYRALAQERKLTLEHRPAHPGPLAWADSDYLSQALKNLLLNAILYTPEGGKVTVSVGQAQAQGRAWATATVADTGMGIPQDELPHIFERFFRGEAPRSMQISGTGLGLAIVQEIVALHGGWVTVESEVGVGSTFTVWLPLIEVQL